MTHEWAADSDAAESEQRRAPRVPVSMTVWVSEPTTRRPSVATETNLTPTGMRMLVSFRLKLNAVLDLRFRLPVVPGSSDTGEAREIRCRAHVVYIGVANDGEFGIAHGLRFELTAADLRDVERYTDALAAMMGSRRRRR